MQLPRQWLAGWLRTVQPWHFLAAVGLLRLGR
jgi:hypothetical protein